MALLAPCKTPEAILLCAIKDERGVLRFPEGGLTLAVQPLAPINPQLVEAVSAYLRADVARHLEITQEFADVISTDGKETATLYVGVLSSDAGVVAPDTWPSMPDILRGHQGRARIPYLRAWQILAGGLNLNTKAVDASEVAKYFDD